MYTPLAPPSDPKALSAFLNGELQRIAQALNQRQDRVQLREIHAALDKPHTGPQKWKIRSYGIGVQPAGKF